LLEGEFGFWLPIFEQAEVSQRKLGLDLTAYFVGNFVIMSNNALFAFSLVVDDQIPFAAQLAYLYPHSFSPSSFASRHSQ
jgi:hypothetical protein